MNPIPNVDSLTHFSRHHRLLEQVEESETLEALREGLRDVDDGRTRPAEEAFQDFKRRHDLPD